MKSAKGKFCGDFPKPKVPFKPQPFFGKYARKHVETKAAPNASQDDKSGKGQDQGAKGNGGTKYPPESYESPPQQTPETQQPPGGDQPGGTGQDGGIGQDGGTAPAPG
jgi:penicillin-binding protein 1A